jgi:putative nucleotidyltransferase with HDIG domain
MRLRTRQRADFLPWSNVPGPSVEVKRRRRGADALLMDIRLSEVISALSYALDVTEGQPMGHAVRSCAIGVRIGEEIGLAPEERSNLFYALLLKDAGCSSNAARLSTLFGADDLELKRTRKLIDHHRPGASLRHVLRHGRTRRLAAIARSGADGAREMTELRCERGADIARMIELSETTAQAIRSLDEHWDGAGYPYGLAGDAIPLFGRILCLAQTAEVFFGVAGPRAALDVAAERRGTWFDPQLVDALLETRRDRGFWASLGGLEPHRVIAGFEPEDRVQRADEERLDRVAEAFAMIVDAKSPYTGRHSEGVARIAVGIADVLGHSPRERRDLRRAALLHDIGKLGVSNLILDKPGKLTAEEWVQMRRHPELTVRILERVGAFRGLAAIAGAHHERLDGGGYHLGLTGDRLGRDARILAVADVCEALTAERPYRSALPPDEVRAIMWRDAGRALCPEALDALAATQELGVLTLATPATAAARPAGR